MFCSMFGNRSLALSTKFSKFLTYPKICNSNLLPSLSQVLQKSITELCTVDKISCSENPWSLELDVITPGHLSKSAIDQFPIS